ncbi:HI1506-related protein [Azorhizobium caulinodans]|uniref:HI1506-related protein n=1 Tax=Azorhizobium caulinodans TaxID=7 RepID=UPI002FBEFE07
MAGLTGAPVSYLKITAPRPGYRRAGIAHPAVKVWPADAFTADELKLLRADPLLTVVEMATAEEATAAASDEGQRRLVTDVIRLLAPDASEPLIVDMSTAVLTALQEGTSPRALRIVLDGLFAAYAKAHDEPITPEGRSGTAREAPSAGSGGEAEQASSGTQSAAPNNPEGAPPADADAPGSTATTTISGAAETEASGAVPASPETEAGEGGKGAEADAAEASPPARSEAAKPRRKAR